jgi:uncharacterized membrane protein
VENAGMSDPDNPADRPEHEQVNELRSALEHAVAALSSHLAEAGRAASSEVAAVERLGQRAVPAWKRVTEGETRWPVSIAAAAAIVLQFALPHRLSIRPFWMLPALEFVLLIGLISVSPRRMGRATNTVRVASIVMVAVVSFGNAWSAGHLIRALINGRAGQSAAQLLATGVSIWVTNVLVFSLWYWELDSGGPAARARAERPFPDFLFPQMSDPNLAPPGWEPRYWDYLYTSFTNASAFSPTDVMPMTIWMKLTMLAQSAISLATVVMVIARAVNILR